MTQAVATRRALRSIATFEAFKGVVALAAGFGLVSLLHRDLHRIAVSLIGHIGLNPGSRYPGVILSTADMLAATNFRSLLLAVTGYALVRFLEAYGLWRERMWGKWLGALSGALYVPLELRHLIYRPSLLSGVVIAVNIVVVGFLAWQIRRSRRAP